MKKNALPKKNSVADICSIDWEKTKINKFWSINCQYVPSLQIGKRKYKYKNRFKRTI